jgi:hypothetical protein
MTNRPRFRVRNIIVVDQNKMGQSKFQLCNSIFLRNPSLRKQVSKIKKKSVYIYFSLFMGINLRIKRFNLQSQIHVRFREPNTNESLPTVSKNSESFN